MMCIKHITNQLKMTKKTQTIKLHDDTTIDLKCKSTLMTCQSSRPTMK